jgi:uncharacterized protein involved in outer membrane biogenesis
VKLVAKIVGGLFAFVIILVVVALGFGLFNLDRIVEESVNRFGPEITGTTVTLEKSSLKPWNGAGSLSGLAIGNPPQFGNENAFSLGEIEVDVDLSSLTSDVIIIDRIAIIQPEVLYLNDGSTDNLRALMANITSRFGSGEQTSEESVNTKKIIIDEFIFSDGRVSASHALLGDQRLTINLPDLELTGIGRNTGGATLKEAGQQIFAYLNQEIRSQVGSSEMYSQALQQVEDRVNAELANLEAQAREQLEQIEEIQQIREIQSQAEEVEDQVRGLLDAFNR